jgi:hypothetical protein
VRAPTISAIKPHDQQLTFCADVHRIDSPAATRNLVGGFYQEAARVLFGASEHQIDSRVDICPDLSVGPRSYIEVKSIGRGRQGLIYQRRLDHDRALVRSGATLTYVFWIHNVEATAFTQREELYAALGRGVERVLVVPFERVSAACRTITPRIMNYRTPRAGVDGPGEEMPGYRLSWAILQEISAGKAVLERPLGTVFGVPVSPVELHGAIAHAYRPLTPAQRRMADELRFELSVQRLTVEKAPAPDPKHHDHGIRVVTNQNPGWYRRLCAEHGSLRKIPRQRAVPDTGIIRHQVERALERLAAGTCIYPYDWLLRPLVERFAAAAAAPEVSHE